MYRNEIVGNTRISSFNVILNKHLNSIYFDEKTFMNQNSKPISIPFILESIVNPQEIGFLPNINIQNYMI